MLPTHLGRRIQLDPRPGGSTPTGVGSESRPSPSAQTLPHSEESKAKDRNMDSKATCDTMTLFVFFGGVLSSSSLRLTNQVGLKMCWHLLLEQTLRHLPTPTTLPARPRPVSVHLLGEVAQAAEAALRSQAQDLQAARPWPVRRRGAAGVGSGLGEVVQYLNQ